MSFRPGSGAMLHGLSLVSAGCRDVLRGCGGDRISQLEDRPDRCRRRRLAETGRVAGSGIEVGNLVAIAVENHCRHALAAAQQFLGLLAPTWRLRQVSHSAIGELKD
jgi:hypothetical protein